MKLAATPINPIDNARPNIRTTGCSRAAPATARTLSSDIDTSATMICPAAWTKVLNQVDHDDLEERCNGLACQKSSHAAGSLRARSARMARVSALSLPPYAWLAILTRDRTGLRTR